jgi:hypothetical protein
LGSHLVHVLIDHRFDLGPRSFRVLFPPLGHAQHVSQSGADLLDLLAALPFVLLGFHALVPLSVFPSRLSPPAFLQKNEPHPGEYVLLLFTRNSVAMDNSCNSYNTAGFKESSHNKYNEENGSLRLSQPSNCIYLFSGDDIETDEKTCCPHHWGIAWDWS